jgi:quercetin dioxygenase-like cupin family protein
MTNNLNYTRLVEKSEFPRQAEVPLDDFFNDARGEITNLLLTPITSVARITSKSGSVRANHYHKTDWHYAFVESGQILYFEREIGALEVPEPAIFKPGQMFFTRPNVEHAMLFPVDSVFYTFAKNIRSHENHESDLERVSFITPEVIARYIP